MNKRTVRFVLQIILASTGILMIGSQDGWWDALGVFLVMYAHNVEKHSYIDEKQGDR